MLYGVVGYQSRSQVKTVPHLELPSDIAALQTLDDFFGGMLLVYSDFRTRCC